jgi:hypothetical protein
MRDFIIGLFVMAAGVVFLVLFNEYLSFPLESRSYNPLHILGWGFLILFSSLVILVVFQGRREAREMKVFIAAHGYREEGSSRAVAVDSRYIRAGEDPVARSILTKEFGDGKIAIYGCVVTIGHMPNWRNGGIGSTSPLKLSFMTCEVTTTLDRPDVFLESRHQGHPDLSWPIDLVGLEKNALLDTFSEHFTVYSSKDKMSQVYSLLNPVAQEQLISLSKNFHIEFSGKKIFIYSVDKYRKARTLEAMNTLAEYLLSLRA